MTAHPRVDRRQRSDVGAAPTFDNITPEPTDPPPAIEIDSTSTMLRRSKPSFQPPKRHRPISRSPPRMRLPTKSWRSTIRMRSPTISPSATSRSRPRCTRFWSMRQRFTFRPSRTNCRCSNSIRSASLSEAMVRASHTLCGIHRTGGFELVATTAKALEQSLLGLQSAPALPSAAYPALARSVVGLHELVGRVRAREPFDAGDVREAAMIQQGTRVASPRWPRQRERGRRGERDRRRSARRSAQRWRTGWS